jgi:phosphorylase kinase alpha/beta subunit
MQTYTPDNDVRLRKQQLDAYYEQARLLILDQQDPVTGLLTGSATAPGRDAWMRDTVYSILAIWGLAQAYRRRGDDENRRQRLEQAVVNLMRGLLLAVMRQFNPVEHDRHLLSPPDGLRTRYTTRRHAPAGGHEVWNSLQPDAIALFLLILAQMTAAGLHIVCTLDEVDLVQNLVYYLGTLCRISNAGFWESHPLNPAVMAESSASVVGMAKAALEALQDCNLFGVDGDPAGVIQVLADDIAQARHTLETLLPRESLSRETDAALLSVIGFPAFAVENASLVERTRTAIIGKLQGRYGCKRFPGDTWLPPLQGRPQDQASEAQQSEHREPEWPLFFTYLLLDGVLRGDREQADHYRQHLENLLVESHGQNLLPECYYLPVDRLHEEQAEPGSQQYLPAGRIPLLWAQSLYWLGSLLQDSLLSVADIDPLERRHRPGRCRHTTVQLALLAGDSEVEAQLAACGIPAQTLLEIQPLQIRPASQLEAGFGELGRNSLLGLPGRSPRQLGSLVTCQVFTLPRGETAIFLPPFLNQQDFYLSLDNRLLTAQLRTALDYIHRHWDQPGQPLLGLLISNATLKSCGHQLLVALLQECQTGHCNSVPVRLGKLTELLADTKRLNTRILPPGEPLAMQHRENLLTWSKTHTRPLSIASAVALRQESDNERLLAQLANSLNLYEQIELLGLLWERLGPDFTTARGHTLRQLIETVYAEAGAVCLWGVVRRAAGWLDKMDPGLEDAVAEILLQQHHISVGRAYSNQAVITRPLNNTEIMNRLRAYGGDNPHCRLLIQEIILFLGLLMKTDPRPCKGILTLRPRRLLLLMTGELAREWRITRGEACEVLLKLSPNAILTRLRQVLVNQQAITFNLAPLESLNHQGEIHGLSASLGVSANDNDISLVGKDIWSTWREISGAHLRLSDDFYRQVRTILQHCQGLVIGDQMDACNYLDGDPVLLESAEPDFAPQVEHLLNMIQAPVYRQLNIEALVALAAIFETSPELQVQDYLILDVLIGTAVQLAWREANPGLTYSDYNERCAEAWNNFYASPPHRVNRAVLAALSFLLTAVEHQVAA